MDCKGLFDAVALVHSTTSKIAKKDRGVHDEQVSASRHDPADDHILNAEE